MPLFNIDHLLKRLPTTVPWSLASEGLSRLQQNDETLNAAIIAIGGVPPVGVRLDLFESRALAVGAAIPASTGAVMTLGYSAAGDGGGGIYRRVPSAPSHSLYFAGGGAYWELMPQNGAINALQAGAQGNGSANDRAAFAAYASYIASFPRTVFTIPRNKTFKLDTSAGGVPVTSGMRFRGEDRWTSKVKFYEVSLNNNNKNGYNHLFEATAVTDLEFRDFTIEGMLDEAFADAGWVDQGSVSMFRGVNWSEVVFEGMHLRKHRAQMISVFGVLTLSYRRNRIWHNKGGGIILRDADNIDVVDNEFMWCRDDAVAIGQAGATFPGMNRGPGGTIRVNDNYCIGCRSLNILGAKRAQMCRNVHWLGKGMALHIGASNNGGNGDTTALDILIADNVVQDLLHPGVVTSGDEAAGDETEGSNSHYAIQLELMDAMDEAGAAGTGNGIPGLTDASGGIRDPFAFHYTHDQGNLAAALPTPHTNGVRVLNNVVGRSLPAGVAFSTLKQGGYYIQLPPGTFDPTPTMEQMMPEGLDIRGSLRNATIAGNQFRNVRHGIIWGANFQGAAQPQRLRCLDVVIENNDIHDFIGAAIRMNNFTAGEQHRLLVRGNRANGDPFHWRKDMAVPPNTIRLPNGKWTDANSCLFFDGGSFEGAIFEGNHIRNVSRIISGYDPTRHEFRGGNIVFCQPGYTGTTNSGYHANNIGIGNLLEPGLIQIVVEGGDPADRTNYGKVLNWCPLRGTAMPAAGYWVRGQRVENTDRAGRRGSILLGWYRLTSGSGNVLGTDWQEERAPLWETETLTATPGAILDTTALVLVDASAGPVTVPLPNVANNKNRTLTVKKIDATANIVTIDPSGAQTIDGAATTTLTAQYQSKRAFSDGAQWWTV